MLRRLTDEAAAADAGDAADGGSGDTWKFFPIDKIVHIGIRITYHYDISDH